MTIPSDNDVQVQLLRLLASTPEGCIYCQDAYRLLAKHFPGLTHDELRVPYQTSPSKWANAVQWAREHLAQRHLVHRPTTGAGRGNWMLTEAGWTEARTAELNDEVAERLLLELDVL